ncbi:MAG: helix-turn-helix domain-containing protein [Bacteroidales bacterium]|nr:helix-turn-helix domain-containing protein [Bacteroidales bacterium]
MAEQRIIIKEYMLGGGLHLQGCELLLFAFIDTFSKHGKGMFCSERYLSKIFGCSRESISRALRRLMEKKLIVRSGSKHMPGQTFSYKVNKAAIAGVTKRHIPWPKNITLPGLKTSHRIINMTDKYDNISKNKNERNFRYRPAGDAGLPEPEGFNGTSRL